MRLLASLSIVAVLLAAPKPPSGSSDEQRAADRIQADALRAHVRFLASDLLEGRGTASRGEALARAYVAAQMERVGLRPGGPDDSWFQPLDVVGVTSASPPVVSFRKGGEAVDLKSKDDLIAFSGVQEEQARVAGEVVFVGYGIVAPEYQWDDYKGMDLEGKVLLMMNNDPENDPALFAGKTRLYYGRWDYKYEIAARQGAAGAILIHTDHSAGYPWSVVQSGWGGEEQFSLPAEGGRPLPVKAWATEESCRRLARLAGQDLDALRAAAEKRDFRPVPFGVTLDLTLTNKVQRKQTANVIGRLPGSDPALAAQAVLFSAHHDHLGLKSDARPGEDAVYNGARDNASGVAQVLALAEAFAALPRAPRRSLYFVTMAAEEQGLLGSTYLAAHPPVTAGRIAAVINVDEANIWGRTKDIMMIGLGKSDLDEVVRKAVAAQGRRVVPDQNPDKGFFYRSDQFPLAKAGVPAAYFNAGTEVIGKPKGWGEAQSEAYEKKRYHQPSDEIRPDWDLAGAVEDARLYFQIGLAVANADTMPAWKPGDEFEAARKKALAEVGR